jgi:lysophospholipase L1-like esterase
VVSGRGATLTLKRRWADPIVVPKAWDRPWRLTRYPLRVVWSDPEVFPCDETGFRIPADYSSVFEKARAGDGRTLIACIGGSTTFGWYCREEESYPHQLENLLCGRANVLNLGVASVDGNGGLHMLVDVLRWGIVPDVVIVLDGINEKQGYLQAFAGEERYRETFPQYEYFREKMEGPGPKKHPTPADVAADTRVVDPRMLRFVSEQADVYVGANAALRRIAEAWRCELHTFLQPTLWDAWVPQGSRHAYLKALYAAILERSPEAAVDLCEHAHLEPAMFFDWQHTTADGNRALAEAIAEQLGKRSARSAELGLADAVRS